jgi:serine/threonine-protein kinase
MSDLPKLIHRYEIVDRLGRGGMGELYLGRDPLLDRFVAIKVLRAGFEGDELRERFAREARSAARLAHVNIVTIYDVGDDGGQPYIAMEYVPGQTVFQIIQRKTELPLGTKLQYIDELCAGLAHAHKAGIVHRDIKPANLIISNEGPLKILDFGIARLADSSMTQVGMVMGTLNYMSPEQISGQPIDQRSDIFAVGAVCYELLAYQQAFPGGIEAGVLSRIMESRFTPLQRVATNVDSALARLIDKALAKDPNDRFSDLTLMREELSRVRQRMDPRVLAADGKAALSGEDTIAIDTPVSTPRTPRSSSSRADLQRRRLEEVANNMAAARAAFAAGRFDEASAACERVLIIDPDNEDAHGLSDRARAAIERQQVDERLLEAKNELERGEFERARELLSSALLIDPRSTDVRKMRAVVDGTQRKALITGIVSRGRRALDAGDPDGATTAAEEALRVDPADADAAALLRDVEAFVEAQQRQAELDDRARQVIPEARRRFNKGEMTEAIALLQAFSPPHPDVTAALHELRTEANVTRERELERERQVANELQQARAALANDDLIVAAAAVARARGASPAHQEVTAVGRAIDARRAEIAAKKRADEDARLRQQEIERQQEQARREAADAQRTAAEAQRKAQEAARKAEDDARRQAAEEARRLADEEKQRRVAEEARRKAEEKQRKADDKQRQAEEKQRQAEEKRRQAAEDAQRKAAAAAAAVVIAQPMPGASPETMVFPTTPVPTPDIRSGRGAPPLGLIAAAAVAVIVIAGSIWFFMPGDPVVNQGTQAKPVPLTTVLPTTVPAQTGTTVETSTLVVDAAPWAEIVEIAGANGPLPLTNRHTPLALSVPVGEYKITLRNPNDNASRVVTVQVKAGDAARAFAEFKPVDVDDYFRRAGS